MTNSKKNPSASSQKPAKTAKIASAKPEAKKKAAPAKARPAAVQAAKTPAKKAASKPAPKAAGSRTPTTIVVDANVGFGNQLFLRGEGAGLSWDHGIPMTCRDSSHWEWTAAGAKEPVTFKILINDQLWSQGENLEVGPGETKVVHPEF